MNCFFDYRSFTFTLISTLKQYKKSILSKVLSVSKKKNLVLIFAGALLPSHGLPPFGANITNIAMSEGLCGTSMFGSDRWGVGVNPMTAGKIY
jgi:hypothetical protein